MNNIQEKTVTFNDLIVLIQTIHAENSELRLSQILGNVLSGDEHLFYQTNQDLYNRLQNFINR